LVFVPNICYMIFVPNILTLIQARLPTKQVKKLDRLMKEAGVLTRAEYLRQIVNAHIEAEEIKKRN
jgi:predicted DNA-binding protein